MVEFKTHYMNISNIKLEDRVECFMEFVKFLESNGCRISEFEIKDRIRKITKVDFYYNGYIKCDDMRSFCGNSRPYPDPRDIQRLVEFKPSLPGYNINKMVEKIIEDVYR